MDNLTWRAATAADAPLLLLLFSENKAHEFAPLGLSPQQLGPMIGMQFQARERSYGSNYPDALNMVLCMADGTPVGRHLVERQAHGYRCIDLAVLPAYQNHGVGTWALQQVQKIAQLESVPFRLRVVKTNRAIELYRRMGFREVSGDEVAVEMEWQAPAPAVLQAMPQVPVAVSGAEAEDPKRVQNIAKIVSFLRGIGLNVELGPVPAGSFLPGIQPIANGLRVDMPCLLYPGDLLHEAGHLAVMTPCRRALESPQADPGCEAAEEMAALAWSYAAALEAGVAPEVVFHDHGYKGQARQLLESYRNGSGVGLPMLWWIGLTTQPQPGAPSIYPRLTRWLREAPREQVTEAAFDLPQDGVPRLDTSGNPAAAHGYSDNTGNKLPQTIAVPTKTRPFPRVPPVQTVPLRREL